MRAVQTVEVKIPRQGSSLGGGACILGILALIICWIPVIGLVGTPLSALGLLLGLIGLLVAIVRNGAGIGLAIAGSAISGLALFVTVAITGSIFAAGKAISEEMKQTEKTNQVVIPAAGPSAARPSQPRARQPDSMAAPSAARPKEPRARQPDAAPAPEAPVAEKSEAGERWASATDTVKQGDVTVHITSAKVGKVGLKREFDGSPSESTDALLV
jgi:hypothetical protein